MSPKATRPKNEDNTTARLARAVSYIRVSTKDQAERGFDAEGFSIPAQRDVCQRKATTLGAVVVEEFVDRGESAKSADRPELQRMLAYIAADPVQYVIVHKVDRLARNRVDDVQINVALRATGATLVSCTENIDETPSGALMHGIMSSIAEFYSRNLANEVIKGSTQKAKAGGTIGKAPTGYLNVRDFSSGQEVRTVMVDPARGPLMAWAFHEYSTGKWSVRKLLDEVTKQGLDTTSSPNNPSKPLVQSHFHRLLRNPYYKGTVVYRGVEYEGRHEPLVSPEIWDRVQHVLTSQSNSGERVREHPHYLKGTVHCGQCGSRLIVTHAKGRRGGIYPYFVCAGRHQKRNDCKQRAMLIEQVEALVEDHYLTIQPFDSLVEAIRTHLSEQIDLQQAHSDHLRSNMQRRRSRLNSERTKLLDGYYAGAISVDLLRSEQDRIKASLDAIERQTLALDVDSKRVQVNLEQALALASNWHAAYLRASTVERRQMNQGIFDKIYVKDDEEPRHEFAEPFDLLLSDEVVRSAAAQHLATRRTITTTDAVDQAWAVLSARWSKEESRDLVGAGIKNPRGNECREGLNNALLVGAEGLEPPTSSV
jgi:site-specific DNA recombinase